MTLVGGLVILKGYHVRRIGGDCGDDGGCAVCHQCSNLDLISMMICVSVVDKITQDSNRGKYRDGEDGAPHGLS